MADEYEGEFKELQLDELSHLLSLDEGMNDERKGDLLNKMVLM